MKQEVYDEIIKSAEKYRDACLNNGMSLDTALHLGWLNVLACQNVVLGRLLEQQLEIMRGWQDEPYKKASP